MFSNKYCQFSGRLTWFLQQTAPCAYGIPLSRRQACASSDITERISSTVFITTNSMSCFLNMSHRKINRTVFLHSSTDFHVSHPLQMQRHPESSICRIGTDDSCWHILPFHMGRRHSAIYQPPASTPTHGAGQTRKDYENHLIKRKDVMCQVCGFPASSSSFWHRNETARKRRLIQHQKQPEPGKNSRQPGMLRTEMHKPAFSIIGNGCTQAWMPLKMTAEWFAVLPAY